MSTAEGMNPSPQGTADELHVVAPQLRGLRRRASLTLEAAARAAGLSPAHLSRLETGQRQPSLPMLLALARIYGTTVSELLAMNKGGERLDVVNSPEPQPSRQHHLTPPAATVPAVAPTKSPVSAVSPNKQN